MSRHGPASSVRVPELVTSARARANKRPGLRFSNTKRGSFGSPFFYFVSQKTEFRVPMDWSLWYAVPLVSPASRHTSAHRMPERPHFLFALLLRCSVVRIY